MPLSPLRGTLLPLGQSAIGRRALFADGFDRANGDIANGWTYTAGLWTIASGKALGTPGIGAELLSNTGFETAGGGGADVFANWYESIGGTTSVTDETTDFHGGAHAFRLNVDASGSGFGARQDIALSNRWHAASAWMKANSIASAPTAYLLFGTTGVTMFKTLNTVYEQHVVTALCPNGTTRFNIFRGSNTASLQLYFDDASCMALTLADQFLTRDVSENDVEIWCTPVRALLYQCGIVACLDSAAAPDDYLLCYFDGAGNVKLDKIVNGVYSNLISVATTYVAGAPLRLVKSGSSVSVYYNSVQRGATQTVSDAEIVSNTRHGLFTTSANNTFDGISIFAAL